MSHLPVISIIGRPNVGKSSLFNRIAGKRIAVVDDFSGVTRDRNYYNASWDGKDFIMVDTGGLIPNNHDEMPEAIHEQVRVALSESATIIFLVDATTGPTDLDLMVAHQLRRSAASKVVLAVNKAESKSSIYDLDTYRSLGLGAPMGISALHGNGVADLLDKALEVASKATSLPDPGLPSQSALKIAIVGRPNAGKSSLVNKLLNQNRMIVSNVPGTTRDSIDSPLIFDDREFVIIDTAGLRKKSHVKQDMEYYSNLRAIESIERADIAVLLIDVTQGIGVQDLRILRKINELSKGVVVAFNKWDLQDKDHRTFDTLVKDVRDKYMELRTVPFVSISALTGQRATAVIREAIKVYERMQTRVPVSEFKELMFEWVRQHPHPITPGKPVRFLGVKQPPLSYPLFRFFVTNPGCMTPAYERYLINKIVEKYDFEGCPIKLEFRSISKNTNQSSMPDDYSETA